MQKGLDFIKKFRVDRLEELMAENKESAQDMLRACSMGRNQFYEWKHNGRQPSIRAVQAMASHYGVSMDYLTGDSDERGIRIKASDLFAGMSSSSDTVDIKRAASTASQDVELSPFELTLIHKFRELTPEKQMQVIATIMTI